MGTHLTTTPITDKEIIQKCKDALNKWSKKLPFAVTRKLGDDGKFISATMYHAYTLQISTEYAHRKFVLEKGGTPLRNPTPIENVNIWNIGGAKLTGNYNVGLPFTCYAETCEKCGGDGKVECSDCHGNRKVECSACRGSGMQKCGSCGGKGEEKCSECRGNGQVSCPVCGGARIGGPGLSFSIISNQEKRDNCRKCGGSTWITCHKCGGSGTKTCKKCHGSGELRCSKCGSTGMVTCSKCKGSGELVCTNCSGKGYISYMYHLVQEQRKETREHIWSDGGTPQQATYGACKDYKNYPCTVLFSQREENDKQVHVDSFAGYEGAAVDAIRDKWQEFYNKFNGAPNDYLHFEDVSICQYDLVISYEYRYKEKDYQIWIDLTSGKVFETEERGLMAEQGKNIATDGDKAAKKLNPQMAIFYYAMACATTTNNKRHAWKLRLQLSLGSWLFRLAAGALGGWLWTRYLGEQGADPLAGWYLMGAMIVIDVLFAQKWFMMQFIAAGAVYGLIQYMHMIPGLMSSQIAGDICVQSYIISCILTFIGATLLFARDFCLRTWGGILVFPIFGALIGGVTAPGMYLDFAPNQELMAQIMVYISYGVCGLAILRTMNRYWVQNCGWVAQKAPSGIVRFETNMLRPRFWLFALWLLFSGAIGTLWYEFAGPGVGVEAKAFAADRFLTNERRQAKGMRYLEEAVSAEYPPAISRLAELKIMGQCGYAEDAEGGLKLAILAGEKNEAKGWRLQGYCLEYGKGVAQNLTAANACYAKAIELGDQDAKVLKRKTDEIASFWELAHKGDGAAQYELARCYADGNGIVKDNGIARVWLLKAADSGNVKAQLLASDWLIKGVGGRPNPELGVKYCEKAALQGSPEAIASLGYYYFDGNVIPRDYQKAVESFTLASDKGSVSAPYMLGYCYREGLGVETNAVKACEFFALADERGSLPGAYAHGDCLEYGKGTEINYSYALDCYRRATAAEWEAPLLGKTFADAKLAAERIAEIGTYWNAANFDGDDAAMDKVGQCYANGLGVERNFEAAYGWYMKSANNDNTDGIVHMADALYDGIGTTEDKNAAGVAYERAYKAGNTHATFRLGICYENGWGVEKNLTTAFRLYTEAAANECDGADAAAMRIEVPARYWGPAFNGNDADAQYNLAMCYRVGNTGLEQNNEAAFKLFRMAADQGHVASLYEVARCYATGIGVEKNDSEMNKAAIASAEKDYPAALYFVGELYQAGRSVEYNPTIAYAYFNKAAKLGSPFRAIERAATIDKIAKCWDAAHKGDADSQYKLGVCYRDGVQIKQDASLARKWFERAVAQGQHDAEYALAVMMSSEKQEGDISVDKAIVALLEKAVSAGHIEAMAMLGKYLYTGKGVDENYPRAIELWKYAADRGDLDARYCLGDYYYTGRGMFNSGKDQAKALKIWEEASQEGCREASLRLAQIYADDGGFFGSNIKDIEKAREYSDRAELQIIKVETSDPMGGFDMFEALKDILPANALSVVPKAPQRPQSQRSDSAFMESLWADSCDGEMD